MLPRLRLVPLIACLLAGSAYGWVDSGHMVVGAIAYGRLSPKARVEADRLLKIGGDEKTRDFVTATCWADDIKRDRPETGPWHYIDIPFREDGAAIATKPGAENVVWAIHKFEAVLGDRSKPDADRAEALRFLLHFIGDVHQPLHATTRESSEHPDGDAGGNRFRIQTPAIYASDDRPPHNLHILWDLGCGLLPSTHRDFRPLSDAGRRQIEGIAHKIEADYPLITGAGPQLDPQVWARESFHDAQEFVYKLPENSIPDEAYLTRGRKLCEQRLAWAGYRLAAVLNQLLK